MKTENLRVHKIRIFTNNTQATNLTACAGAARYAYNWLLNEWNTQYQQSLTDNTVKKPTPYSVRNSLTKQKRQIAPWLLEYSKCIPQEAAADLGKAFNNFFNKTANHPDFKKKHKTKKSFRITGDHVKINENKITFSKFPTQLKLAEKPRFHGRLISATFTEKAGKWYVALVIETTNPKLRNNKTNHTGIDLGVHEIATSNNTKYKTPRSYRKTQQKLKRQQQALARKTKHSKNHQKAKTKLQTTHARIANQRNDFLHKTTNTLTQENRLIVIENLNVQGMLKNKHLAKSIQDAAFGEFTRQLTYKVKQTKTTILLQANQWYPSSKLCSNCQTKTKSLTLSQRTWTCQTCNTHHDRDINAAKNLLNNAESSSVTACGQLLTTTSTPQVLASYLDETGMKQE